MASVDSIPALHAISLRAVVIDPIPTHGEVYEDRRFCKKPGDVALGGVALQKIAAAAGVQILDRKRVDDRSDPNYCEIEVTIGVRDFDGTYRQVTKAREVDLRDGRPEAMKKGNEPLSPEALADRRRHIQSLAETKAFYRALRTILQLKQVYSREELAKPFVVPKLIPDLDPRDPDQKGALMAMALGREASLYGHDGGPMRELNDVTPAGRPEDDSGGDATTKAASAAEPLSPTGTEELDEADFEPMPEQETPPASTCACPCGCQAELSEREAEIGKKMIGTARCKPCYPNKNFDAKKHDGVGDLRVPARPGLTAERVAAWLKGGAK